MSEENEVSSTTSDHLETLVLSWSQTPKAQIETIKWLVGQWKTTSGKGWISSVHPYDYHQEISFTYYGQPLLNYTAITWHPIKKFPSTIENGFLRISLVNNKLAFMVSYNFGLSTIEEGEILENNKIVLMSTNIAEASFMGSSQVIQVDRTFQLLNENTMKVTLCIQTTDEEKCQHTEAVFEKSAS